MKNVHWLGLFALGSADMLLGQVRHNWIVCCLGGFAAGAAVVRLLYDRST